MKTFLYSLFLIAVGAGLFWVLKSAQEMPKVEPTPSDQIVTAEPDVMNMTYDVDGDVFALKNGKAEKENTFDGGDTLNTLTLLHSTFGDLNGDDDPDAAVLLLNEPGGTGQFFYAALVINDKTTKAMFLGDRIAVQGIEIKEGRAVYNYKERKGTDPMTAEPTVQKNVWVHYDKKTGDIGEWVNDFEGESN